MLAFFWLNYLNFYYNICIFISYLYTVYIITISNLIIFLHIEEKRKVALAQCSILVNALVDDLNAGYSSLLFLKIIKHD